MAQEQTVAPKAEASQPGQTPAGGVPATGQSDKGAAATAGPSAPTKAQASGQTVSQPKGATEPGEYEIKVGGISKKVKLEDLIAMAQKGDDYTSKTQKISARERELQEYARQLEERERRLRAGQEDPAEETQEDPIQSLASRQQALEERLADDKLEKTLSELKQKYPHINEKLFLLEAVEAQATKFEDLDSLAQAHNAARESERTQLIEQIMGDSKNPTSAQWRQRIIDEYLAEKAKESQPKGENGGSGAPSGNSTKEPPKDFKEAAERALARLNSTP